MPDQQTSLPAPGTNPEGVAMYVDRLVKESMDDPRRVEWLRTAERNYQMYLGQHWTTATPDGEIRVVLNRTQNAIVSLVSLQAGDPPKITFTPRESSDPPLFYLNTDLPEAMPIMAELGVDPTSGMYVPPMPDPAKTSTPGGESNEAEEADFGKGETQGVQPGQAPTPGMIPNPAEPPRSIYDPLPKEIGEMYKLRIEQERMIAATYAAQGLPPPVPPPPEDLIIEVNDSTSAQALQTIFDAKWEQADAQAAFVENVMNKNILGWQPTLIEFDDEEKNHVLTNVHPKHVFPDPLHNNPKRWAYCVFDQPVSVDEALSRWPHLSAKIIDVAKVGTLNYPGSHHYDPAAMFDQYYQREMVVVRTAWIRYQRYPMNREQAVQKGRVVQTQVQTGTRLVEQPVDEFALPQPPVEEPVMRDALMVDGQEVDEAHELWPTRLGIRQVTVIVGTGSVVDDRECEYPDIPLAVNKNVAIPFSTYGQGEPERLQGLQMAVNRVLSAFVTFHAYNAYPPELIAESVVEMLGEGLKDSRTKPGQRLTIPDSLLIQLGTPEKIVMNLQQGTMTADFWRLLDLLVQYIDMEGNQADVIQGEASASWSGKTVDALQSAANQVIRGKAIYTEFYLKDMSRTLVYNLLHRLTTEDWKRIVSRYPVQAIEAIAKRLKALDIDIAVEIASGSGASKRAELNNQIAARQNGILVSDPTLIEAIGLDPDVEIQKHQDWQRKLSAVGGIPQLPGNAQSPAQQKEEDGKQRTSNSEGDGGGKRDEKSGPPQQSR
jgi:hypothetical protein